MKAKKSDMDSISPTTSGSVMTSQQGYALDQSIRVMARTADPSVVAKIPVLAELAAKFRSDDATRGPRKSARETIRTEMEQLHSLDPARKTKDLVADIFEIHNPWVEKRRQKQRGFSIDNIQGHTIDIRERIRAEQKQPIKA